jgi:uncharacterized membrane protein
VKKVSSDLEKPGKVVRYLGWRFAIPRTRHHLETVIAVNVGGFVIPTGLSLYLFFAYPPVMLDHLIATTMASLTVSRFAKPIRAVGIVIPVMLPPLVTALIALLISRSDAPLLHMCPGRSEP